MSLLSFLSPSKLNVANWKGQMGMCKLRHMCAKNEHVVRNERISKMRRFISEQKVGSKTPKKTQNQRPMIQGYLTQEKAEP